MSSLNTMKLRFWSFDVVYDSEPALLPGEVICVTGSCPQLGNWQPEGVQPLICHEKTRMRYWSLSLSIPSDSIVWYRYCVCRFLKGNENDKGATYMNGNHLSVNNVVIRRWESSLTARCISSNDASSLCVATPSKDVFGNVNGCTKIQRGWLTPGSVVVQFKLQDEALKIWNQKFKNAIYSIKIEAICSVFNHESVAIDDSESIANSIDFDSVDDAIVQPDWQIIDIMRLTSEECSPKSQDAFGFVYDPHVFTLIDVQIPTLRDTVFYVTFYIGRSDAADTNTEKDMKIFGTCCILPNQFKSTEGRVRSPVHSKKSCPIGVFVVDYLVIRPMEKGSAECLSNFSISYAKHWKSNWNGLDVGHRGLGNSYTKHKHCPDVRENTIASLNNAVDHGADMVEFDVQLSKDLVPIIYHDFELCTEVSHRRDSQTVNKFLFKMPLKNLTFEQLRELKIHHILEESDGLKTFSGIGQDHDAFPTLEQALTRVDLHAGFNIEFKWDMELMDGTRENFNAIEVNLFTDTVLECVLRLGGTRKIVFSSFNPDICNILRRKQNKYPVLFLTQGETPIYEPYKDMRTRTLPNASYFVHMSDLLGVSVIASEIQRNPKVLEEMLSRGQVVFSWTDQAEVENPNVVEDLKDLGVNAVIYDRMDMNNRKDVKESIFLTEKRNESILSSPCIDSSTYDSVFSTIEMDIPTFESEQDDAPSIMVQDECSTSSGADALQPILG